MYHKFLIHLSADGYLGCFHVLAIVNSAAVNTGIHVSLSILVSLGSMPSSGIAGSYGSFIPSFFKESPYCFPRRQWHFSTFVLQYSCLEYPMDGGAW